MKENVSQFLKGLHTDNSPSSQPPGTYRFALNTVNETDTGDNSKRANEESNEICSEIPAGYIPLGKVYIGDNETLIFSVSPDELLSEIGIQTDNCKYETLVNADLGFKISQQIQATYRLRRGCEKTVYFIDPKPKIININRLDDFKTLGVFDPAKFDLFKTYDTIPIFTSIEVKEEGNLPPGSYNFSIQYLDDDLNPTEWITTTDTIMIYNDSTNKEYTSIEGSTALETSYQKFGLTNKSIKLNLSELDNRYPFYRIAIIESNAGTGFITGVKLSQEISTQVTVYNYTGAASGVSTKEEIQLFSNIIETAQAISQLENMLILAGTQGKQINFCKLQTYASRIRTDLATEEIILNNIEVENNPKRATVHVEKVGYMPGEMYSFGIVYIFADGSLSPVYHIPGRSWNTTTSTGYYSDMSFENKLLDTFYTDNNSSCETGSMWGVDSEGLPLLNEPVRHHRFPLRSAVNKPLLVEEVVVDNEFLVNVLTLDIQGILVSSEETIPFTVEYEINGNISFFDGSLTVDTYNDVTGKQFIITTNSNAITVLNIYEDGVIVPPATPSASGLTYSTTIENKTIESQDKLYKSEIFGITFSGIDKPSIADTAGEEVMGYYIVRNERTEDEKSIVDTAVLTPLLKHEFFVGHAQLMPEINDADIDRIKPDILAMIHPEHKFGNKEYKNIDSMILEGEYALVSRCKSGVIIQDVMTGTSFDPSANKRRERDSDGFSLHTLTRDNEVKYQQRDAIFAEDAEIKEIFYLDSLNSKVVTDIDSITKEVFNVSSDNKIGIVQLNVNYNTSRIRTKLPFVVLKRNLTNQYSNFRVTPYYKESENYHKFLDDIEQTTIFNGDVFITPMRYHSAVFYDVRLRKRSTKGGLLNYIVGVIAIIVGAIITYYGGGALGVMLISYGVSAIASGITKDNIAKVYNELYEAGLKNTVDDDFTSVFFKSINPSDDEVQWLGDTVTNLWFESTANMAVRQGATLNITDFLNAPTSRAGVCQLTYYTVPEQEIPGETEEDPPTIIPAFNVVQGTGSTALNELDAYLINKLTLLDGDNGDGRLYKGFAGAELYEINPDYRRRNKEKTFFHLGLEYRCCTECLEDFPHRIHHSEQSFQEELTDNYRIFLPNNYRDIEGESGKITDLFRIQNNLYIQTTESLWHLPANYQERVTGDIVSFIGTGDIFNTPPRKIVDDEKSSAGNRHKWGREKTKYGIFFPSENEGKVYQFDGNSLKPISDNGNFSWFKDNMKLKLDTQYKQLTGRDYPYANNPSNQYGTGFVSVYDTMKERFIITKKDYLLSDEITNTPDFELCIHNGQVIMFSNYTQIIEDQAAMDWNFVGMEECKMKFSKTTFTTELQPRTIKSNIPNDTDVYIFYDTSGSFGTVIIGSRPLNGGDDLGPQLTQIDNSVDAWYAQFLIDNPTFTGTLNKYIDSTERWVNFINTPPIVAGANVLLISFTNEANPVYHGGALTNPISGQPTGAYTADYNLFLAKHATLNSFVGINYPIVTSNITSTAQAFVQQSLAAVKGVSFTPAETVDLERNTAFDNAQWDTLLESLQDVNPYQALGLGLGNYGWVVKSDKNDLGTEDNYTCPASEDIISSCLFAEDVNTILAASTETEIIYVEVLVPHTEFFYVEGEVIENPIKANASWTMSYSLKDETWTSAHSYLPNFYFFISDKHYSWIHGSNTIWKHNRRHHYQTFYGILYPHIIEYVSNADELKTKIWNHVRLLTEAKSYNETYQDYTDERYITFNKMIAFNTRQSTGIMNLVVKDTKVNPENYLGQQVINNLTDLIIDRNERDWTINELRDIRIDYSIPIFNRDLVALQGDYFIDKVLNTTSLDYDKHWSQLESFSDKYLVLRFIFDNFDNIRLITNFSVENEQDSYR